MFTIGSWLSSSHLVIVFLPFDHWISLDLSDFISYFFSYLQQMAVFRTTISCNTMYLDQKTVERCWIIDGAIQRGIVRMYSSVLLQNLKACGAWASTFFFQKTCLSAPVTYITKPNLVWSPKAPCSSCCPIQSLICQETVSKLPLKMEGENLQSIQWPGREVARILTWWGGEPSWRMPTHSSWWSTQHCPQKFVISRYSWKPAHWHSIVFITGWRHCGCAVTRQWSHPEFSPDWVGQNSADAAGSTAHATWWHYPQFLWLQ